MWQCECGEFNNDDNAFCVRCNKIRVIEERARTRQRAPMNTQTMFRRIQDFILLDIALTALLVVYCFWRASEKLPIEEGSDGTLFLPRNVPFEAVIPVLVVVILQFGLLVHLLRAFYHTAMSSERNSIFLQKIYEKYEGGHEEEETESAVQSLVKPPTTSGAKERRGPPGSGPPRERGRPRNSNR